MHGRPRAVGRSTARIGTGEIAISSILGNGEIAISSILCTGEIAISSLLARQLESAPVATLRRHPGVRRYLWRKSCDFYGPALLVWCEPRRNRCAIRDRVHVLLTRRVRSHGRHGVRGGRMDLSFRSTGRTHYNSRGGGKSAQKRKRVGPVASYTTLQRGSHPAHPTQIPMLGRPAWRPGRGRLGSTHDGPLTVLGRTATPQPITGRDRITKNETEDDSVHSGREASKERSPI